MLNDQRRGDVYAYARIKKILTGLRKRWQPQTPARLRHKSGDAGRGQRCRRRGGTEPHAGQLESRLPLMESSGKLQRVKTNPTGSRVQTAVPILKKNGMRHENELTRKSRRHILARNLPSRGEQSRSAPVGKFVRLEGRNSSHLQFRKSGGHQQCGPQNPGIKLYSRRQACHRDSSKPAAGSRVQSWLPRITVSDAE